MILDIADLIVELSKERKTNDPVRAIYSVYLELSIEIGKRMNQIREKEREDKKCLAIAIKN